MVRRFHPDLSRDESDVVVVYSKERRLEGNADAMANRREELPPGRLRPSFFILWSAASFLVLGMIVRRILWRGAAMGKVEKETLKFTTPDHFNIAADFYFGAAKKDVSQPCVVLVHQFYQSKEQWGTFPDELVNAGYKVLAYDIRGHGASDKVKDMTSLLSDPQQAPFDFDGALNWLSDGLRRVTRTPSEKEQKGVDVHRLAVVGTSIGGYIACGANAIYPENVKTAVAISSSKKGVLDFLKHKPGKHRMRSVFYIAAKGDGTHAKDAEELAANYTDAPKKVKVFDDASEHGIFLLNKKPEAKKLVKDWLKENLK